MYYRLGTARYALVTTDRGPILRKAGADGPRVGDTKVEGGTTLRFNQNHRWEKVESVAPGQLSWMVDDDLGLDDLDMPVAASHLDNLPIEAADYLRQMAGAIVADETGAAAQQASEALMDSLDSDSADYLFENWDGILDELYQSAGVPNIEVSGDPYEVQDLGDRSPELEALMAKLKADLDAGILDYDDDKWDDYPFELFERAAMELGIA